MERRPAVHAQMMGSRPGGRRYSPPAPRELPVCRRFGRRSALCQHPTLRPNVPSRMVCGANQRPRPSCLPMAGPAAALYQLRGGLGSEASEAGLERRPGFQTAAVTSAPEPPVEHQYSRAL